MRIFVRSLGILVVFGLVSGCHFFDDPQELVELKKSEEDRCALNSGYPCPCTYDDVGVSATGECEDGSMCLYFDDESRGICSNDCDGVSDVDSCSDTKGYGTEGLCWFTVNDVSEPNGCAVFCEGEGQGDCAPGLTCERVSGSTYGVCKPTS